MANKISVLDSFGSPPRRTSAYQREDWDLWPGGVVFYKPGLCWFVVDSLPDGFSVKELFVPDRGMLRPGAVDRLQKLAEVAYVDCWERLPEMRDLQTHLGIKGERR
jgi:hypothetical protein